MERKLFSAVYNNDINEVKMILENGTVPATVTETMQSLNVWTWTLAHTAVENGHLDMLKYLVKKEPSLLLKKIDEENKKKQYSLLEFACERKHFDVVKYLVEECKVDIFEERLIAQYDDSFNATNPIYVAAKYGRLEILKYLIKEGNVDVNAPFRPRKDVKYPKSLLFTADKLVLEYLLKETNIDVTVVDEKGDNILFWYGIHRDEKILKYVLDKHRDKFDINRKNSEGRTFLHRYLVERTSSVNLEFIQYLVEKVGANISIPDDNFKWTPLHFAAANNLPIVCKYLINMGASLESEDKDGDTPLHLAAIGGVVDVCKVLIKHGANKNPKNKKGDSPLHYVINGYYEKFDRGTSLSYSCTGTRSAPKVFAYLIDHGADITQKNNEEKTPLDYIFARGDLKGLKYLIRRGIIGVDHKNEREETLVQLAVIYNQIPILDYLVRKKHADMNARGSIPSEWGLPIYMTPLQTALHLRHYESSKYLMKQGAFVNLEDYFDEEREMYQKIQHEFHLGRARRSLPQESLSTAFQNHSLNNFIDWGRSVSVEVQNQMIPGTVDSFARWTTYYQSPIHGFVSLINFLVSFMRGSAYRPGAITLQKESEDMTIEAAINTLPNLEDIN